MQRLHNRICYLLGVFVLTFIGMVTLVGSTQAEAAEAGLNNYGVKYYQFDGNWTSTSLGRNASNQNGIGADIQMIPSANMDGYHWKITFNKGVIDAMEAGKNPASDVPEENFRYNNPRYAIGIPSGLDLPRNIIIRYYDGQADRETVVKDGKMIPSYESRYYTDDEDLKNNLNSDTSSWNHFLDYSDEIDNTNSRIAKWSHFYFNGEASKQLDLLSSGDNRPVTPTMEESALMDLRKIYVFEGADDSWGQASAAGYAAAYTIEFDTPVLRTMDEKKFTGFSDAKYDLLAGMRNRESDPGMNIYIKTAKFTTFDTVWYCYNLHYASMMPGNFFSEEDYRNPWVPGPANRGTKDIIEWILLGGFPYDLTNQMEWYIDSYRRDPAYNLFTDKEIYQKAAASYYNDTQHAIWYFTDGLSASYNYPGARRLIDFAQERVAKGEKAPEKVTSVMDDQNGVAQSYDYKVRSLYLDNNKQKVGGTNIQNFVSMRLGEAAKTTLKLQLQKVDAKQTPIPSEVTFDVYKGAHHDLSKVSEKDVLQKGVKTSGEKGLSTVIEGLESDTPYTIVEKNAPEGYNLSRPIVFKFSSILDSDRYSYSYEAGTTFSYLRPLLVPSGRYRLDVQLPSPGENAESNPEVYSWHIVGNDGEYPTKTLGLFEWGTKENPNPDPRKLQIINYRKTAVSLGDRVWYDDNYDGLQDNGAGSFDKELSKEKGVANVKATLLRNGMAVKVKDVAYDVSAGIEVNKGLKNTQKLTDPEALVEATTDENGFYSFSNILAGEYSVKFSNLPAGYTFTRQNMTFKDKDISDFYDSDAESLTGVTDIKSVFPRTGNAGQNEPNNPQNLDNPHFDAGIVKPVSIGDFAWLDENNNGIQDKGEQGFSNVEVRLYYAADGKTFDKDPVFRDRVAVTKEGMRDYHNQPITSQYAVTKTDEHGHYAFKNLFPGKYKVEFILPSTVYRFTKSFVNSSTDNQLDSNAYVPEGSEASSAFTDEHTLSGNPKIVDDTKNPAKLTNPTVDAGVVQGPASLGDFVWFDTDYEVKEKYTTYADPYYGWLNYRQYISASNYDKRHLGDRGLSGVKITLLYPNGHPVKVGEVQYDNQGVFVNDDNLNKKVLSDKDALVQTTTSNQAGSMEEEYGFSNEKQGRYFIKNIKPGQYRVKFEPTYPVKNPMYNRLNGVQRETYPQKAIGFVKKSTDEPTDQEFNRASLYGVTDVFDLRDVSKNYIQPRTITGIGTLTNPSIDAGLIAVEITRDSNDNEVSESELPEYPVVSIGNRIWEDFNRDGVQNFEDKNQNKVKDADENYTEKGIPNVIVTAYYRPYAYEGEFVEVGTTTTDKDGYYSFENLPEGIYKVRVSVPEGYVVTKQKAISDLVNPQVIEMKEGIKKELQEKYPDKSEEEIASMVDSVFSERFEKIQKQLTEKPKILDVQRNAILGRLTQEAYTNGISGLSSGNHIDTEKIEAISKAIADLDAEKTTLALDGLDEQKIKTKVSELYQDVDASKVAKIVLAINEQTLKADYEATEKKSKDDALVQLKALTINPARPKDKEGKRYFLNSDLDSDIHPTTGETPEYVVAYVPDKQSNELDAPNYDGGLYRPPVSLGNFVWEDINRDGIQNRYKDPVTGELKDEPGVKGVQVNLYKKGENGAKDEEVATTKTDEKGRYEFKNLDMGEYRVEFVNIPEGYRFTKPKTTIDSMDSDVTPTNPKDRTGTTDFKRVMPQIEGTKRDGLDNPDFDAGIVKEAVSLGDRVWFDSNQNGKQDANELGVAGVTVELYKQENGQLVPVQDNNVTRSTQTNKEGYYQFRDLPEGSYAVKFILPENLSKVYQFTQLKGTGTTDLDDSDVNPTEAKVENAKLSGMTNVKEVTFNEIIGESVANPYALDNPNFDAGIVSPSVSLGNRVWYDEGAGTARGNGQYDEGENPVPNVTVVLYVDGKPATLNQVVANTTAGVTGLDNQALSEKVVAGISDTPVLTTTTNQEGKYAFKGLKPGTYAVQFVKSSLPADYEFTTKLTEKTKDNVSDADAEGMSEADDVQPATELEKAKYPDGDNLDNPRFDAGILKKSMSVSLGNQVWYDEGEATGHLANGVFDNDEKTVENVKVTLFVEKDGKKVAAKYQDVVANPEDGIYDAKGKLTSETEVTTTTDSDGKYAFKGLKPGKYAVQFTSLPTDYIFTTKSSDKVKDNVSVADKDGFTELINVQPASAEEKAQYPQGDNLDNPRFDAGIVRRVSLGNEVWFDENENGLKDEGESFDSLKDKITVKAVLSKENDNEFTAEVPVKDGKYQFTDLVPGSYAVTFIIDGKDKEQYQFTKQTANPSQDNDSDANPATGKTPYDLVRYQNEKQDGLDNPKFDAGIIKRTNQPVSLGDYVWLDEGKGTNYHNGIQDAGETGVAGVTVSLVKQVGDKYEVVKAEEVRFDENTKVTVSGKELSKHELDATSLVQVDTDENGHYDFGGLIPGIYTVQFNLPETLAKQYVFTKANQGTNEAEDSDAIVANPTDATAYTTTFIVNHVQPNDDGSKTDDTDLDYPRIDAGIVHKVSFGDYVWYDKNGDGIQDEDETGLKDVTVTLKDNEGHTIATEKTDENGKYQFTDLVPGEYKVEFSKPEGYEFTTQNQGKDESKDSNVDKKGEATVTVHYNPDKKAGDLDNPTIDAGLTKQGTFNEVHEYYVEVDGEKIPIDETPVNNPHTEGNPQSGTPQETYTTEKYENPDKEGYELFEVEETKGNPESNRDGAKTTGNYQPGQDLEVTYRYVKHLVSLGDHTFIDKGEIGKQDAADEPLSGVTVQLFQAKGAGKHPNKSDLINPTYVTVEEKAGKKVAKFVTKALTTTTDKQGNYQFKYLLPGTYTVEFKLTDAQRKTYTFTTANAANVTEDVDSDAYAADGLTDAMSVTYRANKGDSELDNPHFDAGVIQGGSFIDHHKYYVVTEDGNEILVSEKDGKTQSGNPSNVEDKYTTQKDEKDGYTFKETRDPKNDPTYSKEGNTTTGNYKPGVMQEITYVYVKPLVSVGDYTFIDKDGNALQSAGDEPLENVKVTLKRADNQSFLHYDKQAQKLEKVSSLVTQTNEKGYYDFRNIEAGDNYVMEFDISKVENSADYHFVRANQGDDTKDSDASVDVLVSGSQVSSTKKQTAKFTVAPRDKAKGELDNPTIDAGVTKRALPVKVGDFVWIDYNADGIQNDTPSPQGVLDEMVTATLLVDGHVAKVGEVAFDEKGVQIQSNQFLTDEKAEVTVPVNQLNGEYHFGNLQPGRMYSVQFTLINGTKYKFTLQNTSDDDKDSDADQDGKTDAHQVDTDDFNFDAGLVDKNIYSLGDYVWEDSDLDNTQFVKVDGKDQREKAMPNVKVTLTDVAGNPVQAKDVAFYANLGVTAKGATAKALYANQEVSTTTGEDGYYYFAGLKAGEYRVQFAPVAGYTRVAKGEGTFTPDDSDADKQTGLTEVFKLTRGSITDNNPFNLDNPTIDAGYQKLVSLGDYVWYDDNGNGIQDAGEKGVADVKVYLLDENGERIPEKVVTTDKNGEYHFDALEPGSYGVEFAEIPTDYKFTLKDVGEDTEDSDAGVDGKTAILKVDKENLTFDAGIVPRNIYSLGDYVWYDDNGDGKQNDNEQAVEGVTVTLLTENGEEISASKAAYGEYTTVYTNQGKQTGKKVQTTTGKDGRYYFAGLAAGKYQLAFTLPDNSYTFTEVVGDVVDADNSNVDPATQKTNVITLSAKSNAVGDNPMNLDDPTIDAGILRPVAIGNHVWIDEDGDKTFDAKELPVAGVTVVLYHNNEVAQLADVALNDEITDAIGNVITPNGKGLVTQTDANGKYAFKGLKPGNYAVHFELPESYKDYQFVNQSPQDSPDEHSIADAMGKTHTYSVSYKSAKAADGLDDARFDGAISKKSEPAPTDPTTPVEPKVSLGDRVWIDTNKDGIQDDDEVKGLSGVTVKLFKADGTDTKLTATTNENGYYAFKDLDAGNYYVQFILTPEQADKYEFTKQNADEDTKDSDAGKDGITPSDEVSYQKDKADGSLDNPNFDAGVIEKEQTSDGETETGNPAQGTFTDHHVYFVVDESGNPYEIERIDGTKQEGSVTDRYETQKIDKGGYTFIRTDDQKNLTSDEISSITGEKYNGHYQENLDKEVTYIYQRLLVNLGDYVFIDMDRNGLQSVGDLPLAGVTVKVQNADGTNPTVFNIQTKQFEQKEYTAVTDSSGKYKFEHLVEGSYHVIFTLTDEQKRLYRFTQQSVGAGQNDTIDSDANEDGLTKAKEVSAKEKLDGLNNPKFDAGVVLVDQTPEEGELEPTPGTPEEGEPTPGTPEEGKPTPSTLEKDKSKTSTQQKTTNLIIRDSNTKLPKAGSKVVPSVAGYVLLALLTTGAVVLRKYLTNRKRA